MAPNPPKDLGSVLPMRPMSANQTPRAASSRVRLVTFGTALACAFTLMSPPVAAVAADPKDQKRKVDREIAQLREQLHETSSDLASAYLALRTTQAALPAAKAKLDKATAALAKADQRNDEMAVALGWRAPTRPAPWTPWPRPTPTSPTPAPGSPTSRRRCTRTRGWARLSVALSATSPDDFATKIAMADTVMSVQNKSLDRLSTVQAAATAEGARRGPAPGRRPRQGRGREGAQGGDRRSGPGLRRQDPARPPRGAAGPSGRSGQGAQGRRADAADRHAGGVQPPQEGARGPGARRQDRRRQGPCQARGRCGPRPGGRRSGTCHRPRSARAATCPPRAEPRCPPSTACATTPFFTTGVCMPAVTTRPTAGSRSTRRHPERSSPRGCRRLRQPGRHRPRRAQRCLPGDHVQPHEQLRPHRWPHPPWRARRLRRHDGHLDRLPPALRDA